MLTVAIWAIEVFALLLLIRVAAKFKTSSYQVLLHAGCASVEQ